MDLMLIARFGMVGVLNTLFGYACFAGLLLLGLGEGWALALAMVAGVLFNYQTSYRLVFRVSGVLWRFILLYGVIWLLNWAALKGLVSLGVAPLIAQACLALPVAALSFLGQRLFAFKAVS
jgi:putative flippase GtrA